jgi:hypothetical protein
MINFNLKIIRADKNPGNLLSLKYLSQYFKLLNLYCICNLNQKIVAEMKKWKAFNIVPTTVAIFFLLTSLMFYFYLKKVTSNYAEILSNQSESFQKLRSITQLSNSNFLLIYQMHLKPDINNDSIKAAWLKGMMINSENFTKLYYSMHAIKTTDSIYANLLLSRKKYISACNYFFTLNQEAKKGVFFISTIHPNFISYQNNLDYFTEYYKVKIEKESNFLASNIHKNGLSFLFFGFSPILIIIAGIILSILIVIGFIFSFNLKIISLDI